MTDVQKLMIPASATVHDALKLLDSTGQGILLLVDSQLRLLRVVTDGDLRRLLIAGAQLGDALERLDAKPAVTVGLSASARQAMALMSEHAIDHVPVLDEEGRPRELFLRKELDSRIYLSAPHLGGQERHFVDEAFRTNWIAPLGPNVDAFEAELAQFVGISHAAAVSSGTAAIHLALRLLGIRQGDIVLCSTLTFVASANPILYEGATPVFVDSDPETWNMSPAALRRAFDSLERSGKRAKAVIVVSLYGQSADMEPLQALCRERGVDIIEDAAESLGATYRGKWSGTLGRVGIYSFNGNKIITTSGGGMLVSDDGDLVQRARQLATQARDPAPHYEHSQIGYNYRMSNVLAGIGRGQLRVLEERVVSRRRVFEWYRRYLADVPEIVWMPEASYGRSTRWLTACYVNPDRRDVGPSELIGALGAANIEARPLWKPMHLQPLFAGASYFAHGENKSISDELFRRGMCLPSGSDLSEQQVRQICRILKGAFGHRLTA
jgi:dTDP-4-amino-4,6-dideoxygalactose transaminase